MTDEFKGTPGPVTIVEHSWDRSGIYFGYTRVAVVEIIGDVTEETQHACGAELLANAHMLAASKDMFEALRKLMAQTNNIEVLGEWSALDMNPTSSKKYRAQVDAVIVECRSAIAKALGKDAP